MTLSVGVRNGNLGDAMRLLRRKLARNSVKAEMIARSYPKPSERRKIKAQLARQRKIRSAKRYRDYLKRNQFFYLKGE